MFQAQQQKNAFADLDIDLNDESVDIELTPETLKTVSGGGRAWKIITVPFIGFGIGVGSLFVGHEQMAKSKMYKNSLNWLFEREVIE